MHSKERRLLRKIFELETFVVANLTEENVDELLLAYSKFEVDLQKMIQKAKQERPSLVWEKFSTMTEEEIREEFNDTRKYPDLASIKSAVKGYLDMRKVSRVKTRETLIKHIINTYRRGEFISQIGKEAEKKNEPKE